MANKLDRQRTIREIVDARPVGSQEELRKHLLSRGWDVTQSTLSRDLREMRLARVPTGDGVRYQVLGNGGGGGEEEDSRTSLDTLLPTFFASVDGVNELVVLKTAAGGAQPVSEAIDEEDWPEVMGTIAGENTILVVCRSSAAREMVMRRLRTLAGR